MARWFAGNATSEQAAQQNRQAAGWQAESEAINREKARRRRRASWRKRVALALLAGGGATLGLSGWQMAQSDAFAQLEQAGGAWLSRQMAASGFVVRQVTLSGMQRLNAEAVLELAKLEQGTPIFAVSLSALQRRIASHPQIRDVRIERELPERLHIHITERRAAVIWQHDGERYWLDEEGLMLDAAWVAQDKAQSVPVLTGRYAPAHVKALQSVFAAAPELSKRVRGAQWVGNRRWNIWLDGGMKILLPMDEPQRAWARFSALARTHGLFDRAVAQVDLRLDGRWFLRYLPQEEQWPATDGPLVTAALTQAGER